MTSSGMTSSVSEAAACSCVAPGPSGDRTPANTVKPRESRCRARWWPSPWSHPVDRGDRGYHVENMVRSW